MLQETGLLGTPDHPEIESQGPQGMFLNSPAGDIVALIPSFRWPWTLVHIHHQHSASLVHASGHAIKAERIETSLLWLGESSSPLLSLPLLSSHPSASSPSFLPFLPFPSSSSSYFFLLLLLLLLFVCFICFICFIVLNSCPHLPSAENFRPDLPCVAFL